MPRLHSLPRTLVCPDCGLLYFRGRTRVVPKHPGWLIADVCSGAGKSGLTQREAFGRAARTSRDES